jgi:hypothetical protein
MTVPKPLSKVNKRYTINGYTTLYVQIVVPEERTSELTQKLNNLMEWFMSRNRLKALNKRTYDMSPIPVDENETNTD